MANLIPIGRFAQITHLSVKALRIYADEGLLHPMYVDLASGYRYYSLAQATMAARIVICLVSWRVSASKRWRLKSEDAVPASSDSKRTSDPESGVSS